MSSAGDLFVQIYDLLPGRMSLDEAQELCEQIWERGVDVRKTPRKSTFDYEQEKQAKVREQSLRERSDEAKKAHPRARKDPLRMRWHSGLDSVLEREGLTMGEAADYCAISITNFKRYVISGWIVRRVAKFLDCEPRDIAKVIEDCPTVKIPVDAKGPVYLIDREAIEAQLKVKGMKEQEMCELIGMSRSEYHELDMIRRCYVERIEMAIRLNPEHFAVLGPDQDELLEKFDGMEVSW